MALKILIDANIYLNFYEQKSSGFKMLLDIVPEIRSEIFVSKQISDEVLRGRLRVSIRSIKQIIQNFNVGSARFPEGFKTREVLDWNGKVSQLEKSKEELIEIGRKVIEAVARSIDPVSKVLDPIFSNARNPDSLQIEDAARRKTFGNPPGKADDPLGDQITWVQFLSEVRTGDSVYIVSYDGDYFEKYSEKEVYLNPYLMADLTRVGIQESNIRFFTSLVTALEEIKKAKPAILLPDREKIKEIQEEEAETIRILNVENQRRHFQDFSTGLNQAYPHVYNANDLWKRNQLPPDQIENSK